MDHSALGAGRSFILPVDLALQPFQVAFMHLNIGRVETLLLNPGQFLHVPTAPAAQLSQRSLLDGVCAPRFRELFLEDFLSAATCMEQRLEAKREHDLRYRHPRSAVLTWIFYESVTQPVNPSV
jgi:hypothetical protein